MKNYFLVVLGGTPLVAGRGSLRTPQERALPTSGYAHERERELALTYDRPSSRVSRAAPGVLDKKAFSSKMRMIFLVGLEGSGHHFMNSVLEKVCMLSTIQCPNICAIADALFNGMSTARTTVEYEDGLTKLQHEMDVLAPMVDSLEDTSVLIASFQYCVGGNRHIGEMSFPNYGGEDKPLQYVDVRVLAAEAERVNIDLRVIYLNRSANEILVSTTKHRVFGSFVHEARVLINSAAVVRSILLELSPGFTTCLEYGSRTDPIEANRVAEFVLPTAQGADLFANSMLALARPSWVDNRRNDTDGGLGWDLLSSRLQEKLDAIEQDRC